MSIRPVKFPQQNHVYRASPDKDRETENDLHCQINEGHAVSCWRLSFVDRLRLLFTGHLWLAVLSRGHPPVALSIEEPFAPDVEPGPK